MEILPQKYYLEQIILVQKMDRDERNVRQELIRVWIRILEKYAHPGVPIPSVDKVRKELLDKGVDAAVEVVIDAHWFLFSFMIRDRIESKVKEELARIDLADFIEEVKMAQYDPNMLPYLREKIRFYVMEG